MLQLRQLISGGACMIRGLRGAITIESDQQELVWDETAKLVQEVAAAK